MVRTLGSIAIVCLVLGMTARATDVAGTWEGYWPASKVGVLMVARVSW